MNLIIKIGTDAFGKKVLEQLAKDSQIFLNEENKENQLIIVTSGAVGYGKKILTEDNGNSMSLRQARASIGQPMLMQEYISIFNKSELNVSQILLTYEDLNSTSRIENIKQTHEQLKKNKIIPIVNENDVTAIEELRFGDNDALTTQLAIVLNFNTIINYTQRGALIKNGISVTQTNKFNVSYYDKLENLGTGFGGLKSKLESAEKAVKAGKNYFIAKAGDSIFDVLSQKVKATRFYK